MLCTCSAVAYLSRCLSKAVVKGGGDKFGDIHQIDNCQSNPAPHISNVEGSNDRQLIDKGFCPENVVLRAAKA